MEALGAAVATAVAGNEIIFLRGELGAGKTTLVRGFLTALGHDGNVTSPTYTLVEPYTLAGMDIYHFDLYRIIDAEELETIGIRDYCNSHAICLFEWPERGGAFIPTADLRLSIDYSDSGRIVTIHPVSEKGKKIAARL